MDLPNEIHLMIFDYCSYTTQRTCRLVCLQWANLLFCYKKNSYICLSQEHSSFFEAVSNVRPFPVIKIEFLLFDYTPLKYCNVPWITKDMLDTHRTFPDGQAIQKIIIATGEHFSINQGDIAKLINNIVIESPTTSALHTIKWKVRLPPSCDDEPIRFDMVHYKKFSNLRRVNVEHYSSIFCNKFIDECQNILKLLPDSCFLKVNTSIHSLKDYKTFITMLKTMPRILFKCVHIKDEYLDQLICDFQLLSAGKHHRHFISHLLTTCPMPCYIPKGRDAYYTLNLKPFVKVFSLTRHFCIYTD